jgi:hypothetical protein
MKDRIGPGKLLLPVVAALALLPHSVHACAACYGQSNSNMAQGMNWGIFTLLGFILVVLGVVAGFFVFLARRAAAHPLVVAGQSADSGADSLEPQDAAFTADLSPLGSRFRSQLPGRKEFRHGCSVSQVKGIAGLSSSRRA